MNFKPVVLMLFLAISTAIAQQTQQPEKMVSIPESQLTEQQKQALKVQQVTTVVETAHGWVGIGKELGQAFDSALSSLTQRSNEFAGTKVGKFTMFLVAWKVMGEQAQQVLHAIVELFMGAVEVLIFLPIFLWSYRRSCLTRTYRVSRKGNWFSHEDTYETKVYNRKDFGDFTPRHAHCLALAIFIIIWLFTTFSY